jgi:hypothetical protein
MDNLEGGASASRSSNVLAVEPLYLYGPKLGRTIVQALQTTEVNVRDTMPNASPEALDA